MADASITVDKVQIKTGNKMNLPTLSDGEFAFTEDVDEKRLYIGSVDGNISFPNNDDIDLINNNINDINEKVNSIQTDGVESLSIANQALANSNNAMTTSEIANSRIDNIITNDPSGTKDEELVDFRHSNVDNTTYTTISGRGDAIDNKIGNLTSLNTTAKDSLVNAVNEVDSQLADIVIKTGNKINALIFGFKNDGSDNSDIMDSFIVANHKETLYFPNGTYCFSREIQFKDNMFIELDNNAILKLTATNERFISLNYNTPPSTTYSYGCFIHGGIIDGNFMCNELLGLSYFINLTIQTKLKNFNLHGVNTRQTGNTGGGLRMNNSSISNDTPITGVIGIFDIGNDNFFNDIDMIDIEIAIYTNSSQFNKIHPWIKSSSLIPNSTFAVLNGNYGNFSQCTIDSYHYGFTFTNAVLYLSTLISNCVVMFNSAVYTTDMFTQYPPIVINENNNNYFYIIHGMVITANGNMYMTKIANMSNSIFNGISYHQNGNTILNMQNSSDIYFKTNPNKMSVNKSDDWNALEDGLYSADTYNGSGGSSYPIENKVGSLIQIGFKESAIKIQKLKLFNESTILIRIKLNDADGWDNWTSFTGTAV